MLFNKLLYKLNLMTESEYNQSILESVAEEDEEEISFIEGVFILMFFSILFSLGIIWMNFL